VPLTQRYDILGLLDVFVEADRTVDFTRVFTHSGTTEMRSREALRPLRGAEDEKRNILALLQQTIDLFCKSLFTLIVEQAHVVAPSHHV
jgi:hypothetical protein